ncbi:hypothetical protein K502DRAFT_352359 [Neoconidiobolus thromboides FSU 785]|nr:hypothetical protein K502DRAFT_352359 [Neoconidiobolus thromboides FSU 785]
MFPYLLFLLFNFNVLALCGDNEQTLTICLSNLNSQIEQCSNDQKCSCDLMSKKISCYEPCKRDEEAMEQKSNLVYKFQSTCSNYIKKGSSSFHDSKKSGNKLVQGGPTQVVDPNSSPTKAVYYNVKEFVTATDPNPYYNMVSVYQSMPSPGAYKNQPNSHSDLAVSRSLWMTISSFAFSYAFVSLL